MDGREVCYSCDLAECEREELEWLRDPAVLQSQNDGVGSQGIDVRPHSIVNADLRKNLRHNDQQLSLGINKDPTSGIDLRGSVAYKRQKGEI